MILRELLDLTVVFTVGFASGFATAKLADRFRGIMASLGIGRTEPKSTAVSNDTSSSSTKKPKPVDSLRDALKLPSDRVIVDMPAYLDRHIRRAYISTRALRYMSDDMLFLVEFRYTLVDTGLIRLDSEREEKWLDQTDLPHFMTMTVDTLAALDDELSRRFNNLLMYTYSDI